ncbi:MAG: MBL fold metallo-hydrolase [bacterium]
MKGGLKTFCVGDYETNCYLIFDKNNAILIDPGGREEQILYFLYSHKLLLKYIINTHGHIDHIMGDDEIRKETKAELLIHFKDKEMLSNPLLNLSGFFGSSMKFKEATRTIKEGEIITLSDISLKVMETPGHTPGSISLISDDAIFCGDTIFSNGIGRTDFPGGDHKTLINSIKKLLNFPDNTILYPGHGNPITIKEAKCSLASLINS